MKSTIGIKINEKILLDWINKNLWQYRLWSFKSRDTKLERLLPKNQHNVLFTLNPTTHSIVLLLCVVQFNVNKTLHGPL